MIKNPLELSQYRSILCLNGDLGQLQLIKELKLPVIAADGAANQLCAKGIRPDVIIGDLDSVHPHHLETHHSLHVPCQNSSDYQKCLAYLEDKQLLPAIVLGSHGGYLDHLLNNINIFIETENLLIAPPLTGFVLRENNNCRLSLSSGTKLSIMGIPEAKLSSSGLKWELLDQSLSFPGQTSCFNRSLAKTVTLEVHQGQVLVLIYENAIKDAGR